MQRDVVAALHHARAAAFAEQALGGDRDVEIGIGLMRMQRREQPGAAGAEDQNVGVEPLDHRQMQPDVEAERDDRRRAEGERDQLFLLRAAPGEVFDQQQPQAAEQMHGQQEDEHALRRACTSGWSVQRRKPSSCASPRAPARAPENATAGSRRAQAGEAMHERRDPEQVAPVPARRFA